jgi:CubicO group peptidase (beta-lactamase class C family)
VQARVRGLPSTCWLAAETHHVRWPQPLRLPTLRNSVSHKVIRMRLVIATVLTILVASPARAVQLDQETQTRVDAVFADYDRTTGPGCAVGIVQGGRLTFDRGYGMGSLDHAIALGSSSVFYLASVSKQFTAASVLIAAHEGHLSLDDDVRAHIPEMPAYGTVVTVRNLLHHTSGVRDYLSLMELAGIPFENILSDEDMLDLIARQKELNFAPGSEYLYSNSGYVLLAEIVKRTTGRSLREYADEKIFGPLGMKDTHFHDDRTHIVRDRVFSYDEREGGGWATNYLMNFDKVGDGGLYSTVEDLARWDSAFYGDALGIPNFAEQMYQRGVLTSGDTIDYARGLGVSARRGLQRVAHGGGMMAFRTMLARYPDQRTTVITLCNVGSANSGALSAAIEDIVLKGRFLEDAPASPAGPPSESVEDEHPTAPQTVLQSLAGTYVSGELGSTWILEAGDAELILTHPSGATLTLTMDGEDVFSHSGLTLSFERRGDQAVAFVLQAGRVRNLRFERVR